MKAYQQYQQKLQKVAAPPSDLEGNQNYLESILKQIKAVYIEEALQGRNENDPKLDAGTKSIIIRLRSLKIRKASDMDENCKGRNVANAFYRGLVVAIFL